MKPDYDLISEYERYNLTADEETEMIIVNVYDVKTNTLKRKVELTKLKLMQLIKRYEKTDPDKITWYDRTLLEWGDPKKKKILISFWSLIKNKLGDLVHVDDKKESLEDAFSIVAMWMTTAKGMYH